MADKNHKVNGRKRSLLGMATKIAFKQGRNIVYRAAEERMKNMTSQAEVVVRHVGKLKGAAMKAVQMLTIEAQDILPPEVIKILEQLQSQAPPVDTETMHLQLQRELGDKRFGELKNLSSSPLAAASIGQVYRAEYRGTAVVVKIQYPGVSDSVDSDLQMLKKIVQGWLFIYRKKVNIDKLFEEMTRVLKRETNYLLEKDSLLKYSEKFRDKKNYLVPKVFEEMTTEKVIVMEWLEGVEFTEWVHGEPSLEDRQRLGQLLIDLYYQEFFHNQLVQTDPNPANFLINSKGQLVLLDFGAVVQYDNNFVNQYKTLIRSFFTPGGDTLTSLVEFGFIDPRESEDTKKEFVDFIVMSLGPFQRDVQPFDFSDVEYMQKMRKKALVFMRQIEYSAPPEKIIFLHRKLGGIFFLLRILQIKMDLSEFIDLIESEF